ncbi:unnamed protein product [Phytophthora fragariaefolia]|uniref:Unnamed protein product n=1 Tax=Phytophthora fragariaefolia TaxID=1490495 RepID=A0A9W6XM85_9STRA|nr:unnamed protein product [Phytophthora fragariaefolia]
MTKTRAGTSWRSRVVTCSQSTSRGTKSSADTVTAARDTSRRVTTGTTNNGEDLAGTNAYGGDGAVGEAAAREVEARITRRTPSPNGSSEPSDVDYSSESSSSSGDHTWIVKVDLAVEGARISNRVDWTDEELYYVVGNKLQDDTAKSWVQINKELTRHDRTWSKLKEALLRRYSERLDLAQAEWRVMQRTMQPGETFADFAYGLRDAAGQNAVREETLLGQF